jgi:hypothetical protein
MNKEQEKIAEKLIERMKHHEDGTTNYNKVAEMFSFSSQDMKIVVRELRDDMGLIKDFVLGTSIRLTTSGWQFTSFDDYRKEQERNRQNVNLDEKIKELQQINLTLANKLAALELPRSKNYYLIEAIKIVLPFIMGFIIGWVAKI